ncbi:MAG: nucleoside deaminase [Cyclobacteriaceae bacterium]|nr:nucleoside deaminase [Cyclobacteriaceae bacterium]
MSLSVYSPERFMLEAYKQAQLAFEKGEIPIGAVVVANNRIIARAHNQVELLNDATAHAEMLAITAAAEYLGNKYLKDCTMYVTLEPCVMCAGALHWAQIGTIYYGASDLKRGFTMISNNLLHPKTKVNTGIMAEECQALLEGFFTKLRNE